MTEKTFRFFWVTNPYDIKNEQIQINILSSLKSTRFKIIYLEKNEIYRGLVENECILLQKEGPEMIFGSIKLDASNPIQNIMEAIGKISYIPINFTFKLDDYVETSDIKAIKSVIKEVIKLDMGLDVTDINYKEMVLPDLNIKLDEITQNRTMMFYPYIEDKPIYQNPDIITLINFEELRGYYFVSSDPLYNYALSIYLKENKTSLIPEEIKMYRGFKLIKKGSDQSDSDFDSLLLRIENTITSLKTKGYFTLPSDPRILEHADNQKNKDIYVELASMWGDELIEYENEIIIKSNRDFYIEPSMWYENSRNLILDGDIPKYIIYKDLSEIYTSKKELRIRLSYTAIKSYSDLINHFPLLGKYIFGVNVRPDLSIEIPVASLDQLQMYKNLLDANLLNGINRYKILSVSNINDGVVTRWFYQNENVNLNSLIIEIDGEYYVVIDTEIPESIPNITNEIIKGYRGDLKRSLQKYYRICDNFSSYMKNLGFNENISCIAKSQTNIRSEIPSLVKKEISTLTLTELLSLIPVPNFSADSSDKNTTNNNQSYLCFESSTLKNLPSLFNPITETPLPESTISLLNYIEFGLRGYYTFGIIKGLQKDPFNPINFFTGLIVDNSVDLTSNNYKIINSIEIGTPIVNDIIPEETSDDMKSKIGQIYTIEVSYFYEDFLEGVNKSTFSPISGSNEDPGFLVWLFDMMLPYSKLPSKDSIDRIELEKIINNLWKCGWFLSDWAIFVYAKFNKISKAPYKIHSDLYKSSDSMADGIRGLKILRDINETTCKK